MTTIGTVQNLVRKLSFEWKIDNFFSLSEKIYVSPSFLIAGESFCLCIYPNEDNSVEVYLRRKLDGPSINLAWSFGMKTTKGKEDHERKFTCVFKKAEGYGTPEFLKRSELSEKKSELVPSDVLTIVCHIECHSKSIDDTGK